MKKIMKPKVICFISVLMLTLAMSIVSLARWSYLMDCERGLSKTRIGLSQALECVADTTVEYGYNSGTRVILQKLDDDGDYVGINSWEDYGYMNSLVDEKVKVSDGTYRLKVTHTAYDLNNNPLEIHTGYSSVQTY